MKFLQVAVILSGLLAIALASNASWGTRSNNSTLVHTANVTIRRVNGQIQNTNVNFPANGQINRKPITFINVIDRFTNSSGAWASLWSGGPGLTYATVNLKSQYGQGINSTVQFFVKN